MKRYLTAIIFVVVVAALSVYYLLSGKSGDMLVPANTDQTTKMVPPLQGEETEEVGQQETEADGLQASARYNDGTYTGPVVDAFYGNVQVQAVIKSGKIVNVIFLEHPSERDRSVLVNNRAMPLLTAQAITAQSAKVDGVSGASATSAAFKQSLDGALTEATKA